MRIGKAKIVYAAFGRRRLVQIVLATFVAVGAAIDAPRALEGGAVEFDQGARLAAVCAACHDADERNDGIPPLTSLDEKEIIEALSRYRANESSSIVMHVIALSLTEEEAASVARYLAGSVSEARP